MASPEDIERISVTLQARNLAFLDRFAAKNGYSRSLALRIILNSAENATSSGRAATNNFVPPLAEQLTLICSTTGTK